MLTIDDPRDDPTTRRGKTMIIDCGPDLSGWTGRHGLADLLEAFGGYIDYAKIATLNAAILPESYIKNTLRQYANANIETFAGGLLFEYAYLKNDIDGLIERLRFLNLNGIEVSENYIQLSESERAIHIETLAKAGFNVVYEYGEKYPDKPLDLNVLEQTVLKAMSYGAHHVVVEQGECNLLAQEQPGDFNALKDAPWLDKIFIEVDTGTFPAPQLELLNHFGPEVNIANVAPAHVYKLEMLRRGRGRWIDYPFFKALVQKHS